MDRLIKEFSDIEFSIKNYFSLPSAEKERAVKTMDNVINKYRTNRNKTRFNRMISYLDKKGFVVKKEISGKKMIFITQKGMRRSLVFSLKQSQKEKRKDGKLVLLVFDVPEKSRSIRYLLRSVLRNLGYKMIQQSVWATSYDVIEETKKFIDLYLLSGYVKIFLSENISQKY